MKRRAPRWALAALFLTACSGAAVVPDAPARVCTVVPLTPTPPHATRLGEAGAVWVSSDGDVTWTDGSGAPHLARVSDAAAVEVVAAASSDGVPRVALRSASRHRVSVWRLGVDGAQALDDMTLADGTGRTVEVAAAAAGEHALWAARVGEREVVLVSDGDATWREIDAEHALTAPATALSPSGERAVAWLARDGGRVTLRVATWNDGGVPGRAAQVAERHADAYFGAPAVFYDDERLSAIWTEHRAGADELVVWADGAVRTTLSPAWLGFASPVTVAHLDGDRVIAGANGDTVTIAHLDDLRVLWTASASEPVRDAFDDLVVTAGGGSATIVCGAHDPTGAR